MVISSHCIENCSFLLNVFVHVASCHCTKVQYQKVTVKGDILYHQVWGRLAVTSRFKKSATFNIQLHCDLLSGRDFQPMINITRYKVILLIKVRIPALVWLGKGCSLCGWPVFVLRRGGPVRLGCRLDAGAALPWGGVPLEPLVAGTHQLSAQDPGVGTHTHTH